MHGGEWPRLLDPPAGLHAPTTQCVAVQPGPPTFDTGLTSADGRHVFLPNDRAGWRAVVSCVSKAGGGIRLQCVHTADTRHEAIAIAEALYNNHILRAPTPRSS